MTKLFVKITIFNFRYLEFLLSHPLFGQDNQLRAFLTHSEAPARARLKKGILSRLTDRFDSYRMVQTHPDQDEWFQRERVWVQNYLDSMHTASEKFNQMVHDQESK